MSIGENGNGRKQVWLIFQENYGGRTLCLRAKISTLKRSCDRYHLAMDTTGSSILQANVNCHLKSTQLDHSPESLERLEPNPLPVQVSWEGVSIESLALCCQDSVSLREEILVKCFFVCLFCFFNQWWLCWHRHETPKACECES